MKFKIFACILMQYSIIILLLGSETFNCYKSISISEIHRRRTDRSKVVSTSRLGDDDNYVDQEIPEEHTEMPNRLRMFVENYQTTITLSNPFREEIIQEQVNPDRECNKGFGFPGVVHEDVKNTLVNSPALQGHIVSRLVSPLINKFSDILEFNTAYGDFSASEISRDNGPVSSFKCNKLPLDLADTYGVIAYSGNKVPCGLEEDSRLNVCVLFETCGTAAITLDQDSLKCVAHISKLGEALERASAYISKTSFGISVQRKFPRAIKLGKIFGTVMRFEEYLHRGNFFFSVEGKLPPIDFHIGDSSINQILKFTEGLISLSIGAGRDDAERIAQEINDGNTSGIFEKISNIGLEFAIHTSGKAVLFLDEITSGVFPDLELDIKSFDCLVSTGKGSTGLPLGIYAKIASNKVSNINELQAKIFRNFKSILTLMNFTEEIPQEEDLVGAIEISIDGIGFEFSGRNLSYKCLFALSTSNTSCQFGKILFTALMVKVAEKYVWVIRQVEKFMELTGKFIMEFSAKAKLFARNAEIAANKLATKVSNTTSRLVRKAAEGLRDGLEVIGDQHLHGMFRFPFVKLKK